jgi:hypothetical protein
MERRRFQRLLVCHGIGLARLALVGNGDYRDEVTLGQFSAI